MRKMMVALLVLAGCGGSDDPASPAPQQEVGTVRGRVLAAADSGVAGVAISLQRSGFTSRSATTDASGSYTVGGLATGSWTVTASPITGYRANGSLSAAVQVSANQTVDAPVLRLERIVAPPPPSFASVSIRDNNFTPSPVIIAVNGTVRWTNNGAVLHNTTAAGQWASANLASGATFERTFPAAGTFEYVCTLHAGMSGTVVVQ